MRPAGHLRGTCQCGQVDFRLAAAELSLAGCAPGSALERIPRILRAGSGIRSVLDRHDLTDAEWARLEPLLPIGRPGAAAGGPITGW